MRTKFIFALSLLFLTFQHSYAISQCLNITIKNLKNNTKGAIRVAIFSDEKGYKSEKDVTIVKVYSKDNIKNGTLNVVIPIKSGTYGVAVLDDENNNGKMEYNLLGIPKEGFGFSNFRLKKLKKPKFSDFSFAVNGEEVKDIEVVMRYM